MRISNAKVKSVIISVYVILIVLAILLAAVFNAFSFLTSKPLLTFALVFGGFLIVVLSLNRVSKYFEYNSDGVEETCIHRGILLSQYLNYSERLFEFEKSDCWLLNPKIAGGIKL